eukprot:COSAG05_NODE_558_length_8700_cov_12.828973_1_plen_173_part_00
MERGDRIAPRFMYSYPAGDRYLTKASVCAWISASEMSQPKWFQLQRQVHIVSSNTHTHTHTHARTHTHGSRRAGRPSQLVGCAVGCAAAYDSGRAAAAAQQRAALACMRRHNLSTCPCSSQLLVVAPVPAAGRRQTEAIVQCVSFRKRRRQQKRGGSGGHFCVHHRVRAAHT